MITLRRRAERDLDRLLRHFGGLGRPEAQQSLLAAVDEALRLIGEDASSGLPAPRPYPKLARPGQAWIKSGRYWIAYSLANPPVIVALHDSADIPGRL